MIITGAGQQTKDEKHAVNLWTYDRLLDQKCHLYIRVSLYMRWRVRRAARWRNMTYTDYGRWAIERQLIEDETARENRRTGTEVAGDKAGAHPRRQENAADDGRDYLRVGERNAEIF